MELFVAPKKTQPQVSKLDEGSWEDIEMNDQAEDEKTWGSGISHADAEIQVENQESMIIDNGQGEEIDTVRSMTDE